ncbi:FMN-binding protein [Aliarcobacter butzleri]|uniref:FMN-binding protein n=1 Tax=Aliarcobacter butzleri TaxID=28197 RepID=UPI00263C5A63|nr:FMN-binding protein [Aliarcobacter butzleri]MDN5105458.1 FMN-binding protein [Aliarcobacter butzleri]
MNSKIESILNHEGIFSIVAKDEDFPHIVNTWNTFVIFKDNNLFVPVGGMNKMEEILEKDNRVIVVIGTRELMGIHGPGIGIKIIGKAEIFQDIEEYEAMKNKYEWARAVMKIEIMEAYQTT